MARNCFFSFQYQPDCVRAVQARNIGVTQENAPASHNDWESIIGGGDAAIERWISTQIDGKTCTLVLVGGSTAGRKRINHEIVKFWDKGLCVVGTSADPGAQLLGINQRVA